VEDDASVGVSDVDDDQDDGSHLFFGSNRISNTKLLLLDKHGVSIMFLPSNAIAIKSYTCAIQHPKQFESVSLAL
jgi:hypothetical protein